MKVSEIFYSIQGEGIYIGQPMAFIRFTGCNLRCRWCDTKYAYDEGSKLSIKEILECLKPYPTKQVCLTGGEPMLQDDTPVLIEQLIKQEYLIYLETNGSILLDSLPKSAALKISMDIKCPSSGEEQRMDFDNLVMLQKGDQVKFIIADKVDYTYAKKVLDEHSANIRCDVILTPCDLGNSNESGNNKPQIDLHWLAEQVIMDGINVRVLPQLHKLLWPNKVRGV